MLCDVTQFRTHWITYNAIRFRFCRLGMEVIKTWEVACYPLILHATSILLFGTVRSEVRILSPRPTKSTTYGCLQRWPYFICGQFVDIFFNQSHLTRESKGSERIGISLTNCDSHVINPREQFKSLLTDAGARCVSCLVARCQPSCS